MFYITETAFDRARHALSGIAHRGGEREGECMRPGRQLKFVVVIAALACVVTGVVLATPASGVLSGTVVARASFQDALDIKFKVKDGQGPRDVVHLPNARETVTQPRQGCRIRLPDACGSRNHGDGPLFTEGIATRTSAGARGLRTLGAADDRGLKRF
jgi:hypothetical protein